MGPNGNGAEATGAASSNGGSTMASSAGSVQAEGGNAGAPVVEPVAGAGGVGPDTGILLVDDFEDQNDDGWFPTSGDWEVDSDGSSQVYRIKNLLDASLFSVIGDLAWTDVVVEAKVRVLEWGNTTSSDLVGIYARFSSPAEHYYVALRADGKLAIRKKVDTNVTLGTPVELMLEPDVQYRVKLEVVGSELKAYVDDVLHLTVTDSDIASGRIALGADYARAEFDDVRVTLPEP